MVMPQRRRRYAAAILLAALAYAQTPQPQRQPILAYIKQTWAVLTRSNRDLAQSAADPKFQPEPDGLWPAYLAWAPLEMIAVEGLRRYGYTAEADRISREFLSMIDEQYRARGIIVEKYDAVRRSMDVSRGIQFGYSSNEAGFGWTNAVFTKLFDELPPAGQRQVLRPAPR